MAKAEFNTPEEIGAFFQTVPGVDLTAVYDHVMEMTGYFDSSDQYSLEALKQFFLLQLDRAILEKECEMIIYQTFDAFSQMPSKADALKEILFQSAKYLMENLLEKGITKEMAIEMIGSGLETAKDNNLSTDEAIHSAYNEALEAFDSFVAEDHT